MNVPKRGLGDVYVNVCVYMFACVRVCLNVCLYACESGSGCVRERECVCVDVHKRRRERVLEGG